MSAILSVKFVSGSVLTIDIKLKFIYEHSNLTNLHLCFKYWTLYVATLFIQGSRRGIILQRLLNELLVFPEMEGHWSVQDHFHLKDIYLKHGKV